MPLDAQGRITRARIAGLAAAAKAESAAAMTAPARRAFLASFYEKTDPELPPGERARQADAAFRAHMAQLGAKARAAKLSKAAAARGRRTMLQAAAGAHPLGD